MLRTFSLVTCLLTISGAAWGQVPSADRNLVLQFEPDGRVRLAAHNVSLQEILSEWARQCQCFVVNGNQLPPSIVSVPLMFDGAPQAVVLRSLLKDAGGYVLTPRRPGAPGPSIYETIYLLPAGRSVPMASFGAPFVPQATPVTAGSPDDEIEPVRPIVTPLPVDPAAEPPSPPDTPRPGVPGVSVPAVQVMPITPSGPAPGMPAPGTSAPAPAPPPRP
jgi:hypothetical protein